jgi:carboxylesterase type B
LFLDLYVLTNATTESNLPVMVVIQGGGFLSDSNGDFNSSMPVEDSGMNMIVITLDYRVDLLGFAASQQIIEGGSLNNGLEDGDSL